MCCLLMRATVVPNALLCAAREKRGSDGAIHERGQ